MSDASSKGRGSVRQRIQESLEQARQSKKRELFRQRVVLARDGLSKYESHRFVEAASAFQTYIRVLEEWHGVEHGDLTPANFDLKEDSAELLLLSGIYWDLAKLFDRTDTDQKLKDFKHYMNKFVIFSKGMPFQAVSAETLRKYISTGKTVHTEEFKAAYKTLADSRCFIATELMEHTQEETLMILRDYRDRVLLKQRMGKIGVRIYYRIGPFLAQLLRFLPISIREKIANILDRIAKLVQNRTNS